jgi:ATP diphosphatase
MPEIKALLDIMTRLRDPEGGCPWDLEQDFSSISPHTIEEAYEVDDAIARGDLDSLRDELGDLLFQVVFQARIAEEMGAFDFGGVIEAIVSKLIRRHPHVFADAVKPNSVSDQAQNWESIKDAERKAAELSRDEAPDPFAGIPRNLPALARSAKLAGRLARLERREAEASPSPPPLSPDQILSHLAATLSSAQKALTRKTDVSGTRPDALRLVGEGLRAWVGVARALDVDPEQALRGVDDETIASFRK